MRENGITVEQGPNIITLTPDWDPENPVGIYIPNLGTLGINPAGEDFHFHVRPHKVGTTSELCADSIWTNLQEQPWPTFSTWSPDTPATNGQVSTLNPALIGDVKHWIDEESHIVVNTTEPGHILYPGLVIRYFYEKEGSYYITTIGLGNGNFGDLNNRMADWIWAGNVEQIRRESLLEGCDGPPSQQRDLRPPAGGDDDDGATTDVPVIDGNSGDTYLIILSEQLYYQNTRLIQLSKFSLGESPAGDFAKAPS